MAVVVQFLIDAVSIGSLYALFALGIGLIFGIMRLINFAHGEIIMAAGYAMVFLAVVPATVRIVAALVLAVGFALAMERVAFRKVRGAATETLLVTSFAVSFLLQSVAALTIGSLPRSARSIPVLSGSISLAGFPIRRIDLVTIVITALLLLLLVAFFARTSLGIQMRAAAENFQMARALGVRTNTVIATAFAISGLLAGVGMVILVAQTGLVHPRIGLAPVLAAFVATIIGGLGSLTGAVVGGYVLGGITATLQTFLPVGIRSYREAFVFAAVVVVLIVRPQGLVPSRSVSRTY